VWCHRGPGHQYRFGPDVVELERVAPLSRIRSIGLRRGGPRHVEESLNHRVDLL